MNEVQTKQIRNLRDYVDEGKKWGEGSFTLVRGFPPIRYLTVELHLQGVDLLGKA